VLLPDWMCLNIHYLQSDGKPKALIKSNECGIQLMAFFWLVVTRGGASEQRVESDCCF